MLLPSTHTCVGPPPLLSSPPSRSPARAFAHIYPPAHELSPKYGLIRANSPFAGPQRAEPDPIVIRI